MSKFERDKQYWDNQFQDMFGEGFVPFEFQRKVAEHILNGRNVILQAPTGAGKTKAALFPYLLAQQENMPFPRKLLYTTPMRVLAKNFHTDFKESPVGQQTSLKAEIQTGENQDDRQFRSDLIFTTIDQVLSSFLNIPYSLGLRQGNVNAGAVVGSYLIFDEFHLFDPDTSLGTVIEMLKMLNGITPFLLMTATFSKVLLERLSKYFNAEIVPVTEAELKQIPSQQGKRREYRVNKGTLSKNVDAIIERHQQRSIVICNTVARAQEIYQSLWERRGETEVFLLHSRFRKEHRKVKEDMIRCRFKQDAEPDNVILVATQVIEVGLDITSENLHTELAPASAIFQRAGRCARFENECGTVAIYPVPPSADDSPNYAPYDKETCEATLTAFQERNEDVLDFAAEQQIINKVHSDGDERILEGIGSRPIRNHISEAISGQELGLARELIRKNDSRTLLVHDHPEEAFPKPFRVEGFSLYRGTLFGAWDELQQAAQDKGLNWCLKYPKEMEDNSPNSRIVIAYEWREAKQKKDLGISPLFVVHPKLVTYNDKIGFRLKAGETHCPLGVPDDETTQENERGGGLCRETYTQHIQHLLNTYQSGLAAELSYAAARLEQKLGVSKGAIDQAIRLCIALHDVGKLTVKWQEWAHRWQQAIDCPLDEDYMAAHTDYERDNLVQRERERNLRVKRPPHAVESMRAIAPILVDTFSGDQEVLLKASLTAIARHHAPKANQYQAYTLHPASQTSIETALQMIGEAGEIAQTHLGKICRQAQPQPLTGMFVSPYKDIPLLTYFLIVRALRLADQEATSHVSR
ncbi:MAG: CRISPR-associated helicase Cas3' [Candidatus Poribacteria bacterium]|nr:CRISPR-associated helicase Cas3' [Candidatus Poribacteria bacterium]